MTYFDIIEVTDEHTILNTLPMPEGYDDVFEFLGEYLSANNLQSSDDVAFRIEVSSLYDKPRFEIADDILVSYFINSSDELEYTTYYPQDGGSLTIDRPITEIMTNIIKKET